MKIKSAAILEEVLQNELSWRKKELSLVVSNYTSARESAREHFWRSGIVLLYSHWEGFIKKAAQAYLTYLVFKGYKYSQLKSNFISIGIPEQFKGDISIKKFGTYEIISDFMLNRLDDKFSCNPEIVISARDNLKYEVLNEIISIINIKDEFFELKKNLIDEQLVKYRNAIAHGEKIDRDEMNKVDLIALKNEVMSMLEFFNTKISNAILQQSYLKD